MAPTDEGETVYARQADAEDFATRLLTAHALPDEDARTVARCLIEADLRGVDTHGLVRLPGYLRRLRAGLVNPRPELAPHRVVPSAAALDGRDGLGFVVASRAMAEAVRLAEETGIGVVSVRRSTHFGMAASYVLRAVEAGMVALVFTNASPAMPPWGGRQPLLGTSPLAAGAPGGERGPVVLDMSPAVVARGKIRRAARRGEEIPLGYALDAEGVGTTDPLRALEGVVLPVGGPKGAGLSLLMDILAGVLSGAAFAGDVGDQYKDFDRPQNVGHLFLALRPDLFLPLDEYRRRMDLLVDRVRSTPRAAGVEAITLPGELEAGRAAHRALHGIPYAPGDLAPLRAEAERAGVAWLPNRPAPLSR
ncbi:Ldh family oxidoreductase [Streptomyces sp. NBRC 109706]|uniref:Ldh family oxidoreductase n=1 Tax=Streptomyces sp. NBRC 109706 TaxID=1550035 RepID=UPI0007827A6B|nr:Ldh family oxidoreductase [Streptomyces sp. NBRC 109706]